MEFRLPDLRDRVVVVTGGARGMGRAYARAFLSEGAKVVLADQMDMFCLTPEDQKPAEEALDFLLWPTFVISRGLVPED